MIARKWKRFIFKRGYMPDGDARDMQDRLRERLEKAMAKAAVHLRGGSTILTGEEPPDAAAKRYAAFRREADAAFLELVREEGDAQWDRIIDRRMSDWFYSAILSGALGFIIGWLTT